MNLEQDLEKALRRESPAPGFAGRVMERIEREETQRRRKPVWWRAAAASVLFTLVVGGYGTHKYVEHQRGERAKEQVLEAMRIAGEKVRIAQQEVREISTEN
jgi:hypothetical protein